MTQPLVSVLIPVLDEERHVERALARALDQEGLDGEVEVLVVDGRSTDRTRELVEAVAARDPRVHLLDNPARLIPNALNVGLRAARGEYVARMDAHTGYPPSYLATGIARLRRGGAVWVAGPQLARGDSVWSRRVALALGTKMGVGGASFRSAAGDERETDAGFTGVWRRETLLEHDGWDEDWPINEDGELAARIRATGGRILTLPAMAADYVPRDSLRKLAKQYWRYGQYRCKTSQRHPESMRRSHILPPAFVLALGASLLPGRAGLPGRAVVGIWALAALGATASASAEDDVTAGDLAALPAVFATMHVAWGAGFLAGSARFGPPLPAIARVLRP